MSMRISFVLPLLGLLSVAAPAQADVLISVDKSTQLMTVAVDGATRYVWPVSTGAPGYDTPSGQFKPFRMEADHFSKEWDDAPMPHSIFFTMQGHAIHGSTHLKGIGKPVSHGCVRLEPKNAAVLFDLVKQQKMANTHVVLTGQTPGSTGVPVARRDLNAQPLAATAQRDPDGYPAGYAQRDQTGYPAGYLDQEYTASVVPRRQTRVVRDYYGDDAPRYYRRETPYVQQPRDDDDRPLFGWPFRR
jgi:L,D-transpeptidase-like protein